MIEAGLIVVRFLHYTAVITLAGASSFPIYVYPRSEEQARRRLNRRLQAVLFVAANVALLSGVLWFVFTVANMSGTFEGVLDREMLATILHDTAFGDMWIARLVLSIMTIVAIWNRFDLKSSPRWEVIEAFLAAALLISLAGVGHSQVEEGMAGIHIGADAAHLLAAGAWLGGLVPLALLLATFGRDPEITREADLDRVLMRFSGMGYVAVATLLGSGLINSWYLVGTVNGLPTTLYGELLLAKLVLFAGMLVLAVVNRFWLVPSMNNKLGAGGSGASFWTGRLRNHVLGEQILGLMVLLAVSVLGTIRPAIGQ